VTGPAGGAACSDDGGTKTAKNAGGGSLTDTVNDVGTIGDAISKPDTGPADTGAHDVGAADAGPPDTGPECTGTAHCPAATKPCDKASCTAGKCAIVPRSEGAACPHGQSCVLTAVCKQGKCEPVKEQDCDDGDVCTKDTCKDGLCFNSQSASKEPCDDGNPCTKGEQCAGKLGCSGGDKVCDCDTYEDCALLDDGDPCNGTLYCDQSDGAAGKCLIDPASVVICDKGNDGPCELTSCDPKLGKCTTVPAKSDTGCEDGNPCTTDEKCDALGNCVAAKNTCACEDDAGCAALEDGNVCNGTLFCDTAALPYKCSLDPSSIVVCDPGLDTACSANLCDAKTGKCAIAPLNEGGSCADGDACTAGDHCKGGVCVPGKDICSCKTDADCAIQEDGDLCNGTLFCNKAQNICQPDKSSVVKCTSLNDTACRKNKCVAKTGKCQLTAVGDGAACDDAEKCTAGDTCQDGACKGSANTCECKDDKDCVAKDDGDKCNGLLYCHKLSGKCLVNPKTVVNCPSVNDTACVQNACAPLTGACTMTAASHGTNCDDNNPCTVGDHCEDGDCSGGTNTCACAQNEDCLAQEDGDACNGMLFCNKTTGKCQNNPATVVVCQTVDNTLCKATVCAKKTGKCEADQPINNGLGCDDGNPCTHADSCLAGKCQPGTMTCQCATDADCLKQEDADKCTGALICDKSGPHNLCKPNPATTVTCALQKKKDGPCVRTDCNPKTGKCDTTAANEKAVCGKGTLCTSVQICLSGVCTKGKPLDCDDGNPCTVDTCDDFQGCKHKTENAVPCNDDNKCTSDDVCVKGFCTGTSVDCDDGTPCTQDVCAPLSGCEYFARPGKCDDGDACTYGDVCAKGSCVSGQAVNCDDANLCTEDGCDAITGCTTKGLDKPCNDGNACTLKDHCTSGICLPGKDDDCDAGNDCTVDSCDKKTGCAHEAEQDEGNCSDGDLCTEQDACKAGKCVGDKIVCQDNNPCTADACEAKTGACAFTAANEGQGCRTVGKCAAGSCIDGDRGRVYIPAGPFSMGCNEAIDKLCDKGELPQHEVSLAGYWIDLTEATVGSYEACVVQGGCPTPSRNRTHDPAFNWTTGAQNRGTHPMNGVTWLQAVGYCAWKGGKLPTEAQWEKVARGGCSLYPDGKCAAAARMWVTGAPMSCADAVGQSDAKKTGCDTGTTAAVGSKPLGASLYGALDMAGNVAEWTADWFDPTWYSVSGKTDPAGPKTGDARVYRGGGAASTPAELRISRRAAATPDSLYRFVGMRCAYSGDDCNDANPCTKDTFDAKVGKCVHTPADGAACYDGTGCTVDDACKAGKCVAGKARDCDDDNPCTTDACITASGTCAHKPVVDGKGCGVGGEVCASGACVHKDRGQVRVPDSTFFMGCNAALDTNCAADEKPQHAVSLSAYWIDRFEVTKQRYRQCIDAGACKQPALEGSEACRDSNHANNNWTQPGRDKHPINCVTQADAAAYCAWVGGALPTEAQWEKAARGGCERLTAKQCSTSMRTLPWARPTIAASAPTSTAATPRGAAPGSPPRSAPTPATARRTGCSVWPATSRRCCATATSPTPTASTPRPTPSRPCPATSSSRAGVRWSAHAGPASAAGCPRPPGPVFEASVACGPGRGATTTTPAPRTAGTPRRASASIRRSPAGRARTTTPARSVTPVRPASARPAQPRLATMATPAPSARATRTRARASSLRATTGPAVRPAPSATRATASTRPRTGC